MKLFTWKDRTKEMNMCKNIFVLKSCESIFFRMNVLDAERLNADATNSARVIDRECRPSVRKNYR